MANIPITIYTDGTSPFPVDQQTAWGAAFALLVFVLILSVVARLVAGRLNRQTR